MNENGMHFYAKICSRRRFDYIFCLNLTDNCVKMDEHVPVLPATKCSPDTVVSGDIHVRFINVTQSLTLC